MSYNINNIIKSADFNTIVSGTNSGQIVTTVNNVNALLGVGYGDKGYGQSTVTTVNTDELISAQNWIELTTKMMVLGQHQNALVGSMKFPKVTDPIVYIDNLVNNLNTVTNTRLSAKQQGPITTTVVTNSALWSEKLTMTFQVNFQSGDAARYFFNAGGQLKLSAAHTLGTGSTNGLDRLINSLLSGIGNIYLSAPNTGTINISGSAYTGVTQTNATSLLVANPKLRPLFNSVCGYYALNNTDQVILKQFTIPEASLTNYSGTYVTVSAYTNGMQGANGDTGSQITVTLQIVVLPSGKNVPGTTSATLEVISPSTAVISNSWGNVTSQGSAVPLGVEIIPPPLPNIICISVMDETSLSVDTIKKSWVTLRKNYPSRPFYLLQPRTSSGLGSSGVDLKVPTEFASDMNAFGPLAVKRDNGVVASRSDWFTICNLSSAPLGSKVALNIDNSGSMKISTVQASLDYFKAQCLAAGIPITSSTSTSSSNENWAEPFDKSF